MKSWAMGKGGQVKNWNDECLWKTLKIVPGFLLRFQCFLICESWFTCDCTAPYKAVTQNCALKKITEKEGSGKRKRKLLSFNIFNLIPVHKAAISVITSSSKTVLHLCQLQTPSRFIYHFLSHSFVNYYRKNKIPSHCRWYFIYHLQANIHM